MATEADLQLQDVRPPALAPTRKEAKERIMRELDDYYEKYAPEPLKGDSLATTLLEFFSVTIQRDTLNDGGGGGGGGSSFDIYGRIKLTSNYGREFFLFNRDRSNPETVVPIDLGNNTAILPKPEGYCPCWLPEHFRVEVHLVDKSRNVTIVDKYTCELNFCQRKLRYDEEQEIRIPSRGYGRVTLKYTIFRCAVMGKMSLQVTKKNASGIENSVIDEWMKSDRWNFSCPALGLEGATDDVVSVTGSISVDTDAKGKSGRLSRVLCDIQSMSLTMNDRAPLPGGVAVPAYSSSLTITADLAVNGVTTGEEDLVWECELVGNCDKEFTVGEWRFCLWVAWPHPLFHLRRDELFGEVPCHVTYDAFWGFFKPAELLESKVSCPTKYLSCDSTRKRKKETCRVQVTRTGTGERFKLHHYARTLVEVFSVYVGSFSQEKRPLRVCGTIKYNDACNKHLHVMFEKADTEPELVFPNESISLLKTPLFEDSAFGIRLDLKVDGGREISNGCVGWPLPSAYRCRELRLCSVVRGECGFACVHYAMFDSAVSAKVHAKLLLADDYDANLVFGVSGSIYAGYSNYRCSTNYEKNFYRSRLFQKKKKEGFTPASSYIPLSKDVVVVPSRSALVLEVNILAAHVEGAESMVSFRGELVFDPSDSREKCFKGIDGEESGYILELEVEWG